ncbi:Uncharacterised protein [uncultured archaeon]|nr:Uncharacterised protein [uncultured archaeon]
MKRSATEGSFSEGVAAKSIPLLILFAFFSIAGYIAYGIPAVSYVAPTLSSNSTTGFNWTYINITSTENLTNATLEWGNSSGFTNVSMLNTSLTNWSVSMTNLADGTYNYTIWAQNTTGNWSQSARQFVTVETAYHLVSCRSLITNGSYVLMQNVSSAGTCFTIKANNITLDGAGYWINYSQGPTAGYAVNITGYNYTTIKNLTIAQGNGSVSNSYAIYGTGISNSTITNNLIQTYGINSSGIYFNSLSNSNTISNNAINTSGTGIILAASNSNILSGNNITASGSGSYGILLNSSNSTAITGGSILSPAYVDYYLVATDATNNFTNTNFTGTRNISFADSTSWFNYNSDGGSIWLKTNVSAATILTRTLINWSASLMQWNDTNSTAGIVANYNVSGLRVNTLYNIFNTSRGTQTNLYNITSDAGGNLNFTIALNGNTGIAVDAPPVLNVTSPLPGNYYNTGTISVNVTLDKSGSWCGVSLNGTPNQTMTNLSAVSWGIVITPSEGANNVTFWCNDTGGNMGNTSTILFTKDTTTPGLWGISADTFTSSSAVIHWTAGDTAGDSLSARINYSTDSNNLTLQSSLISFGNGTSYITLYGLSAGTGYYYKVTICDLAGNCNISSLSANPFYTTTTSTTTTTTTTTGSSGGTASDTSKSWSSITAFNAATMSISSSSVDVTYVEFTPSQTVSNAQLSVAKLSDKPSSIASAPPGTVFEYISFSMDNITDSQISSASITFKVTSAWLSSNNLDSSTVTLYRYSGGKWVALSTSSAKGSTATSSNYVADTPGFSYFAIAAQVKSTTTQQTLTASTQTTGNTTQNSTSNSTSAKNETAGNASVSLGYGSKTITILIIVVVLIAAGAAYYAKYMKLEPKENLQQYGFKFPDKKTGDLVYKKPEKEEKTKYSYKPK